MKVMNGHAATVVITALLVITGGGCSSVPTVREFYDRESGRLGSPERRLLVETIRVLFLLEDYRTALETREMEAVLSCYSRNYSHYEEGLDWLREKIRTRFITPFSTLTVALEDISVEFVQKDSGYWIRQEDFDWLRTLADRPVSGRPVVITMYLAAGPITMTFGESSGSSLPPRRQEGALRKTGHEPGEGAVSPDRKPESGPLRVTVSSSVDPGLERPLGEVKFHLRMYGSLVSAEEGKFTCLLEEKVVFLLEKEGGRWKIVSQW